MGDQGSKYKIGYGKPPLYTRFKKGQPSPNPKGRPLKPKAVAKVSTDVTDSEADRALKEVLDQQVTIRDAKGTRKSTKRRALDEKHVNVALEGNPIALRDLRKEVRELEARDAERERARAERKREAFHFMVRYRITRERIWRDAVQNNVEPDDPWPHPDDILINEEEGTWQTRGPYDNSGVLFYEYIRVLRDLHLTRAVLALREKPMNIRMYEFWDLCWKYCDRYLPLRWQIMPIRRRVLLGHDLNSVRRLREFADDREREAVRLERYLGMRRTKETYRIMNTMLKPVLTKLGFRSLAEMERKNAADADRDG